MALNFPGPFEVRLFYTTNEPAIIAAHQLRLSCNMSIEGLPGEPFSDWIPIQKNGSAVTTLAGHVDALVTAIRAAFHTSADFERAELWEYAPGTFDAVFRSAYDVNVAGSSATVTANFAQTIWTFRTTGGGIAKLDLRGTIYPASARASFPTSNATADAIHAYMLAPERIWIGRDGGYVLAGVSFLPGSNEHAFKKVNR